MVAAVSPSGGSAVRRLNITLACLLGVALPLGETLRKWGTNFFVPLFIDDYLMGGLLLFGAWRWWRTAFRDARLLLTAWAFSCGMLYLSAFGNLERHLYTDAGREISSTFWVSLIFLAFGASAFGLLMTLYQCGQLPGPMTTSTGTSTPR